MKILSLLIVEVGLVCGIAVILLESHAKRALDAFRSRTLDDPLLEWTTKDWLICGLTALFALGVGRFIYFPIVGGGDGPVRRVIFWLGAALAAWALVTLLRFVVNPIGFLLYSSDADLSAGAAKRLFRSDNRRKREMLLAALRHQRGYKATSIAHYLLQLDDPSVLEPLLAAYRRNDALWHTMIDAFRKIPDVRGISIALAHEGNGEDVVAALTEIIRTHESSVEVAQLQDILGRINARRFWIYHHTEDSWVNPTPDWDIRIAGGSEEVPVDTGELERVTRRALSLRGASAGR